ncbi:MAG TPA: VOC family protein [Terriglobales bacterium]|nr:VOC family protein [Terriglobales bacterium]
MSTTVRPFLMFEGRAEEAMNFYISLFADGKVTEMVKYGPGQPGPEGTVMIASFVIAGQTVLCSDSFVKHGFTFTPSLSMFVTCEDEAQIKKLSAELASGGGELMPLGNYGFSRLFAWVNDRFGVSWQLMLP